MSRNFAALVIISCLVFSLSASAVQAAPREEYGKVEVLRDKWGVPHVFSDTDEGAMYGLGYATAEDRAFQMYYSLRIMQGRLAEVVGDVRDLKGRGTASYNDKKMRMFGFYRAAKKLVGKLDAETVGLLEAYSEGVNDYIAANGDKLLYLFEKLGVEPEPWTPAECIVSWWHVGQFFATDGLSDFVGSGRARPGWMSGRARGGGAPRVGDEAAAVVQREDVSDEWVKRVNEFAEKIRAKGEELSGEEGPQFSHAWVVGGKKSTSKSAVLCSMPQTPVRNPSLFYEFHVSGKTLNARGMGVAGSPVILIGWNENVAWGMTALGADQADLFMLKTDAGHPNQYFFDGEWRDMKVWDETIKIKGGQERKITIRETHLGPVVTELASRSSGQEVALKRIPICEGDRDTTQGAIAMMRSKDVYEFGKVLGAWRFPTGNAVFGDRKGNIGYWTIGAAPVRSPLSASTGRSAHDGSASKYDWQGIVPNDLHPHVINPKRGYLATANHRSIASFYPLSTGGGTGSGGDTVRSYRLKEMLRAKEVFSPEDVSGMQYDSVNPAKRDIARLGYHVRDVMKGDLSNDALSALEYLEGWYKNGAASDMSVKGSELANVIPTGFRQGTPAAKYGGGQSGLCHFLKTMDARLKEDPKGVIEKTVVAYVDTELATAWRNARGDYGSDPEKWQERAMEQIRARKLGYFESLDRFPSVDPDKDLTFPDLPSVDGNTIRSPMGQSYIQWVPMHDVDSAKTILPIGQSEHPGSPFRTCNLETWAKGELHPAPITREGVEKYAAEKSVLSK